MPNITAYQPWDVDCLKERLEAELELQREALGEQDWELAEMEAVRRASTGSGHYAVCRSPACRRARRCIGNMAPCKRLPEQELKSAYMQRLIEGLYARIQHERRAAAYEGRQPCASRALADYKPWISELEMIPGLSSHGACPRPRSGMTGRPGIQKRR